MTSIAKKQAVSGVPKSAEKSALMPHITASPMSCSLTPKSSPMRLPILPPSCSAAPSRPAEPPNRCVIVVPTKMSGAVEPGMEVGAWMASSTPFVSVGCMPRSR